MEDKLQEIWIDLNFSKAALQNISLVFSRSWQDKD